jgi:hypothetical protein
VRLIWTDDLLLSRRGPRKDPLDEWRESSLCNPALRVAAAASECDNGREVGSAMLDRFGDFGKELRSGISSPADVNVYA